jgi:trk system potassium uptake protein
MKRFISSDKLILFLYFLSIIFIGSVLLSQDNVWKGINDLEYIDALFTSVSAVCVTGLITVNTADFNIAGQIIIMLLIQAGGLGIITFTTLFLTLPGRKISFRNQKIIKDYFIDSVEHEPRHIIRSIIILTIAAELIGSLLLFKAFSDADVSMPYFAALFHSISAFCNAGFSIFGNNLESFNNEVRVTIPIMGLIVFGGLGFVVIRDIYKKLFKKKRRLSLHSKIVLAMTVFLIIAGTFLVLLFERNGSLSGFTGSQRYMAALFQSITPRTAGFNLVPQETLSLPTKFITLIMMFIGGSPGSIAGGVKVTTFFLLLTLVFSHISEDGELTIARSRIGSIASIRAAVFVLKAIMFLGLSIFALTVTEVFLSSNPKSFLNIIFETFSAFGTVGLSLGITPLLTKAGKLVIIFTMFVGRVGLVSLVMRSPRPYHEKLIDYPKEEVMVG